MTPAVTLIAILNLIAYAGLVLIDGDLSISTRTIAAYGGLLPTEWMGDAYWRYLASGFLHFSALHILTNGICLLAWGVPLERLYGAWRLATLFLGAIVAGAVASVLLHDEPFVSAGASGGVSGLLGALLALQLAGRIGLPASFFVINLGLNIAVALFAPGIDWQAHLGGFAGGMALALLLAPRRTAF